MAFENVSVELTMNGASGEVAGMRDDEPMCMHNTVPVSWQAAKNGSQWRPLSCTEGRPSGCGFSENVTAKQPRAALRRTSAAASCGSHSGTIPSGISRSEEHTSELQSLMRISYAVFCLKQKKTHINNKHRELKT